MWGNCRRLVCVEPEEDAKINVSLIKQLSGGDEQEVRALYGDMVNFEPQFKVDLLCNKMIAIDGSDTGAKRRIRAQHWPSKFTFDVIEPNYETNEYPAERTEVMTARFAEWRDDLMLFLIDRYKPEYVEDAPLNVKKFTDEYMDENNIFALFCRQYIEKSNNPRDGIALKHVKAQWPVYTRLLVDLGYAPTRPSMPKLQDLKNGLAGCLNTTCQERGQIHGRAFYNVFKGFALARESLEDRERDEVTEKEVFLSE